MTKLEDIWACSSCGQEHGRHDMCFDGLCEVCVVNSLTAEEEKHLEKLRIFFKKDNGLDKISGGFCNIVPKYFSADEIHCLVKLGSSDDVGSYTNEFIIEVDRNKLDFDFIY
jgi:hypothetical protein